MQKFGKFGDIKMLQLLFEKKDIVDEVYISQLFEKYQFDGIVHLAAESHVDRSITNPMEFTD